MSLRDVWRELWDSPYKIWYKEFDENGNEIGSGVYPRSYKNVGNAHNIRRKHYGDHSRFKAIVAKRDPWVDYFIETVCDCCGKTYNRRVSADGYDQGADFYIKMYDADRVDRDHRYMCDECATKIADFIASLKGGQKE